MAFCPRRNAPRVKAGICLLSQALVKASKTLGPGQGRQSPTQRLGRGNAETQREADRARPGLETPRWDRRGLPCDGFPRLATSAAVRWFRGLLGGWQPFLWQGGEGSPLGDGAGPWDLGTVAMAAQGWAL